MPGDYDDILDAIGVQQDQPDTLQAEAASGGMPAGSTISQVASNLGKGIINLLTLPGRTYQGTASPEEQYNWGPQMALSMLGAGTSFVPRGALSAAGALPKAVPDMDEIPAGLQEQLGMYDEVTPPAVKNMLSSIKNAGQDKPGAGPDISEEAIEKALDKNPGASIFDVSGTHVGGQSQNWNSPMKTFPGIIFADIDRNARVPYVPLAARVLGKSENLLHGTRLGASNWETPTGGAFGTEADALRLPSDELGVHFGNAKQAQDFTGQSVNSYDAPRQYPVVVATNNPLELCDSGTWTLSDIKGQLKQINNGDLYGLSAVNEREPGSGYAGTHKEVSIHLKGQFPKHELDDINSMDDLRQYLSAKGYDSIKYVNKAEDPGNYSWIKFTPSPEAPDYVSGVRSPWAKFDPTKLARPELAAGLAGASTLPLLSGTGNNANQNENLLTRIK